MAFDKLDYIFCFEVLMTSLIGLRHPVIILVTVLTNPDNLTNDLLILKLFYNKQLSYPST